MMDIRGTGIFENDAAIDAMQQAIESTASEYLTEVAALCEQEYLEFSEANQVMIAGVILDALLNDTSFDTDDETFDHWLDEQSADDLPQFRPIILRGLKLLMAGQSELKDLWTANEMDYPNWLENLDAMIDRLEGR
ncbi:DUF4259 domain-containing protein [Alkanindiges sp. WGS2144]|uniref:DUF4259 domain-containing protein n=1 Tax=Alkanindiges sp. WGS2144 TaxID=3366808 RepID=UPI003752DE87